MAFVSSDLTLLATAGVKTVFNAAYIKANTNPLWQQIATEIPTTLPIQNYAWLGRGAVMEEFKDEQREQSTREVDYIVADKIYAASLTIARKALEDDQYGVLAQRAQAMAEEAVRHWDELAYIGLAKGFSATCYDGQYFLNPNHQEGTSPIQSNITSASLSDAALEAAEAAMMAYVDDKNKPLQIRPNTLVVGPALQRKAWNLVGQPIYVSQVGTGTAGTGATAATSFENYFNGRYNLVVSPYLVGTYAFNWFLLDTSRAVKPIIIQSRSDVPITFETDVALATAQFKETYTHRIRGRYAQAYGLWQTAYGSNATS